MEDAMMKKNTDCLFFLASPLACKNRYSCEFRHSEAARFNLKDCKYWQKGCCFNRQCAFRHLPLENLPEQVHVPAYATTPASKSSIPCYFYLNARCMKGEQCKFLHDTPPNTAAANLPERKASTGSNAGPASVEVPGNHPTGTSEPVEKCPPVPEIVLEEPPPKLLDKTPFPPAEYDSHHLDQGSEEEIDKLLSDGSEQLPYVDKADYMCGFEKSNHAGKNRNMQEYFQRGNLRKRRHSRGRISEADPHSEQNSFRRRHDMVDERDADFHDHQRKRRKTDGTSHNRDRFLYSQPSNRDKSRWNHKESTQNNRIRRLELFANMPSRREKSSQVKTFTSGFPGPKSLAQIKEEKLKAIVTESNGRENYVSRYHNRHVPEDFESPKPLHELLKNKRRLVSSNEVKNGLARTTANEEDGERSGTWAEKKSSDANSTGDKEKQTTG